MQSFVTSFLHLTTHLQDSSVITHINIFFLLITKNCFIVWLNHLSIHQLMELCIVSTFWLLILLWILVYELFYEYIFLFSCHWILSSEWIRLISPPLNISAFCSFCLSSFYFSCLILCLLRLGSQSLHFHEAFSESSSSDWAHSLQHLSSILNRTTYPLILPSVNFFYVR